MSSGVGAASAPTLSRVIGRLAGGKDNAGRQDAERVEGLLQPAEQADDLLAVDPLEQSGAEPAVAMLARGRAAQPNTARRSPPPAAPPRPAPIPPPDLRAAGSRARARRRRGRRSPPGYRVLRPPARTDPDVLADPLQRAHSHPRPPAASGGLPGARRGSGSRRGEAPRAGPQLAGGQRRLYRRGPRPHALRGVRHRLPQGARRRRARSRPAGWPRQRPDLRPSRCAGPGRGRSGRAARRPRARGASSAATAFTRSSSDGAPRGAPARCAGSGSSRQSMR